MCAKHGEIVMSIIQRATKNRLVPFRYFAHTQKNIIRYKYGRASSNPWKKLYISPQEITLYRSRGCSSEEEYWNEGGYWTTSSEYKFDKWADAGEVYSGEWDIHTLDISKLPKYVGMKERFIKEIPWEETSMFDYYRSLISCGYTIDGCNSEDELLERYEKIEKMCKHIRANGYKPREKICDSTDFRCLMDEVTISIGRDGQYIFGDGGGWHRLCAAKIFDIDTIPVRVLVRHGNWHAIRQDFASAGCESDISDENQNYIGHPDLLEFSYE